MNTTGIVDRNLNKSRKRTGLILSIVTCLSILSIVLLCFLNLKFITQSYLESIFKQYQFANISQNWKFINYKAAELDSLHLESGPLGNNFVLDLRGLRLEFSLLDFLCPGRSFAKVNIQQAFLNVAVESSPSTSKSSTNSNLEETIKYLKRIDFKVDQFSFVFTNSDIQFNSPLRIKGFNSKVLIELSDNATLKIEKFNWANLKGIQDTTLELKQGGQAEIDLSASKLSLRSLSIKAHPPQNISLGDYKLITSDSSAEVQFELDFNYLSNSYLVTNGRLMLSSLAGYLPGAQFSGLSASMNFTASNNTFNAQSGRLEIDNVALGPVPLNFSSEFNLDFGFGNVHRRVNFLKLKAQIFGGTIFGQNIKLDLSEPNNEVNFKLSNISLTKLLALYPNQELQGEGILSGQISVQQSASGWTGSGQLASTSGGVIRYNAADMTNLASNPSMSLAIKALKNYHYSDLKTDLQYLPTGQLILKNVFQGANPDLNKGQSINFNLNIEENLPALMRTLQISDEIAAQTFF